ncbi:CsbD family protein [Ilumatobacter sp.]|uniref:CsbD family protein n=1 Tax=Ilumatobacter sp. TaxID=1967498 RepID=UPI003B5195F6
MSGESDKVSGRAKQAAGDLTGDDEMKREGETEESAGKVKDKVGDAVDGVKDKLS